jgi:hypothetical protein
VAEPREPEPAIDLDRLTPDAVLALQQKGGNVATQRVLQALGRGGAETERRGDAEFAGKYFVTGIAPEYVHDSAETGGGYASLLDRRRRRRRRRRRT